MSFKVYVAQVNPIVGDLAGNSAKVLAAYEDGVAKGADVVIAPELVISGYPPQDLLRNPKFVSDQLEVAKALAARTDDATLLLLPFVQVDGAGRLYNAVGFCHGGEIKAVTAKVHRPNYGVFDEKRHFTSAADEVAEFNPQVFAWKGEVIGAPICEDLWQEWWDVPSKLKEMGATVLIAANASPYRAGVEKKRLEIVEKVVKRTGLPLVYCAQVGGTESLFFDGGSMVAKMVDGGVEVVAKAARFVEDRLLVDVGSGEVVEGNEKSRIFSDLSAEAAMYLTSMFALKDYVNKTGAFDGGVVLGLSGGADSALVSAMCVDAFGAEKVLNIMLPYEFTSSDSLADAEELAKNFGARYEVLPIHTAVDAGMELLAPLFEGMKRDVTEENLQSRQRMLLLMAVSNKFGKALITTGNKSELALGYGTLYGDMAGAFNPIKNIYKVEVFELLRWRNSDEAKRLAAAGVLSEVATEVAIPERIITKAPSAELAYGQKDSDSLPEYAVLDPILQMLVDEEKAVDEVAAAGFDVETVRFVARKVKAAEFKRFQAPPGPHAGAGSFGPDRRYPLVNGYGEGVLERALVGMKK